VKVPALVDYPGHLARLYVIAHQNDDLLSKYYVVNWKLVPDLASDFIVPITAKLMGIFSAGKLFILLMIFLTTTGTYALHYSLYRKLTGPVLCFVFIFNGIFLFGFLNYLFAIGLALWATAGWVALQNSSGLIRSIFAICAVSVLFLSHFGGVGLYALAIFCYEVSRLRGTSWDWRRICLDAALAIAPFLIVIPLMLESPTSHDWASTDWPVLTAKWVGLYFIIRSTDIALDALFACFLMLFLSYLIYFKRVEIPRIGWLFLLLAGITYLIVPGTVLNVDVVDIRLPVAFVFFLIAMVRWRIDTPTAAVLFNGIIGAVVAVRVLGVAAAWQVYSDIVSDYEESFAQIEPGSRVLVTRDIAAGWQGSGNRVTIGMDRLTTLHLPALATIERSCLVPIFADPGKQILTIRRPYSDAIPIDPAGSLQVGDLDAPSGGTSLRHRYLRDWRDRYDYLYVQYAPPGSHPNLPNLTLLYQGRSFQLYQVAEPK
jgi:hypothetical protein